MPTPDNKLAVCFGKQFSLRKFRYFQPSRLPKRDLILHEKNSLPISLPDMHMNGLMVIAVEEKYVAVFSKDSGHD